VCLESSSSSSSNTYTIIDGGLLFIPHGMLIALRGSGGADTKLVKYCFTDASNLHTVRHNAAIEVLFDKERDLNEKKHLLVCLIF
jgi:hypothetical protein